MFTLNASIASTWLSANMRLMGKDGIAPYAVQMILHQSHAGMIIGAIGIKA
jgi:hypothetical protein